LLMMLTIVEKYCQIDVEVVGKKKPYL